MRNGKKKMRSLLTEKEKRKRPKRWRLETQSLVVHQRHETLHRLQTRKRLTEERTIASFFTLSFSSTIHSSRITITSKQHGRQDAEIRSPAQVTRCMYRVTMTKATVTKRDISHRLTADWATLHWQRTRLWGAGGQEALESAQILLVNATAVGCEILKNLVLPGRVTITRPSCPTSHSTYLLTDTAPGT